MKDLHYELMTALRGPDSYSNEARAWKQLVTAPYRSFFMKYYDLPDNWCRGERANLLEMGMAAWVRRVSPETIANAVLFKNSAVYGHHVASHVRDALSLLLSTICFPPDERLRQFVTAFRVWAEDNRLFLFY